MGFKKSLKAVARKAAVAATIGICKPAVKLFTAGLNLDYIWRHPNSTDDERELRLYEEYSIFCAKNLGGSPTLTLDFFRMKRVYKAEGEDLNNLYSLPGNSVYFERRLSFLMTKMQMRPSYDAVAVRHFNAMLKVIEGLGGAAYARDDSSVEVEVSMPRHCRYISYEQLAFIHKMEDIYLKDIYDNPNKED